MERTSWLGGRHVLRLGHYDSEEQAARAYDKAALRLHPRNTVKLNYPLKDDLDQAGELPPEPLLEAKLRGQQLTSCFRRVSRAKESNRWLTRIGYEGRQIQLGTYASHVQAACAYDKAALRLKPENKVKLNHPLEDYLDKAGQLLPEPRLEAKLRGHLVAPALSSITHADKALTSNFRGVYHCRSFFRNRWNARIWYQGRCLYLGIYASDEQAARAYDKAALRLKPRDQVRLNFPLKDYLDEAGELLPERPWRDRFKVTSQSISWVA